MNEQVLIELRPSREGCYIKARIEGVLDGQKTRHLSESNSRRVTS
jgi:hypothetical protein